MNILGKVISGAKAQTNLIGAPSFAQVNPYGLYNHFKCDDYASQYPNVRPITNELMTISPYAINSNGKPVPHAVIDALHHPNRKDSLPMFLEKVGVSVLALPYTYLLVWRKENGEARPGGDFGFGGKNIAGFTFLENPGIEYRDGVVYYSIGSQQFTENDVIAIPGGAKPGNLYAGYSPAQSAAKWATLDGYIADFQNGFFENNAIPAGVFKVAAPTPQEYKDMVELLKERHKGAGSNNNVSYTHVPIDKQGNQAPAQIEWIPFAQSNREIDFAPLLEHVDNRLSESYGVSSIIKGVDSAAKYSNAEVSEAGFAKRAVKPLALRIYSQITHELNRITGGLGISIVFKYEIPVVSDADLVKAKTKRETIATIKELLALSYSLDSIVDALQLPQSYKLLVVGKGSAVIDNDKPEVDEGDEVKDSPDPDKIDGVTPLSKGEAKRTNPKGELSGEQELERVALDLMESQVNQAISAVDSVQDVATDQELDKFVDDALEILSKIIIIAGAIQTQEGRALLIAAGLNDDLVKEFVFNDDQIDRYRAYLRMVGQSYSEDTTQAIRLVLDRANIDGASAQEIKKALADLPDLDKWRATRIARTETVRAGGNGSLYSMEQIIDETGYELNKVWQTNSAVPCPYCQAMNGRSVPVKNAFVSVGGSIVADDGSILVNDFVDMDIANSHPNCRCSMYYEVVS